MAALPAEGPRQRHCSRIEDPLDLRTASRPEAPPPTPSPAAGHGLLALQRLAGNRAVTLLLGERDAGRPRAVQPEITIQRVLRVRRFPIAPGSIAALLAAVREKDPPISKTLRKGALYTATTREPFPTRRLALLELLQAWAADGIDSPERAFGTWEDALAVANAHLISQESQAKLTPEQVATRKRAFEGMKGLGSDKLAREEDLSAAQTDALGKAFPQLLRSASFATDVLGMQSSLAIERRKKYKASGERELTTAVVRYRTYSGTISPKANAFVTGQLPADYGPLLKDLVRLIRVESGGEVGEKGIAELFLKEFEGADAFKEFSKDAQILAHKIITVIYFAEMSRKSIALVSAVAAFYAIAAGATTMATAFETGSEALRPFFAGEGGASLMRGERPMITNAQGKLVPMPEDEVERRRARGVLDIQNLYNKHKREGEDLDQFVHRMTLEITGKLSKNTDRTTVDVTAIASELVQFMKRVTLTKKGGTATTTLTALGIHRAEMIGDENDCAIYTVWDQLTRVRGIDLGGDFAAFRDYVRTRAAMPFGAMIDVLTHGAALLAAVSQFMVEKGLPARSLVMDVWSATADGNLMEFQNVAQIPGPNPLVLTFYFNGVNHFDSLSGGIVRL